jgi:hypothetical protein
MNDWESLEQDFINYLRTKRGPCPENETLVAFHELTLPADQSHEVQAHVRLCGTCQLAMQMLERFDESVAEEVSLPPDWPEIEQRGRERFSAFLESRKPSLQKKPSFWDKLRGMVLRPAFAYLLLAALAYPAFRGLFGKPEVVTVREKEFVEVAKPTLDIAAIPKLELKLAERAAFGGPPIVQLAPDDNLFAVSFFVPIRERPEFVYDLEFHDSQGQLVTAKKAVRAQDELGNFFLVCRRELFSPGKYELQVREVNTKTQKVMREFRFPFRVSEGGR